MHLDHVRLNNHNNGKSSTAWYPNPNRAESLQTGTVQDHTAITLGAARRLVRTSDLEMALKYNAEFERRTRLGHDCAAFALSCVTNDQLSEVDMSPAGDHWVKVDGMHFQDSSTLDALTLSPGDVAITTNVPAEQGYSVHGQKAHLAVTTNVDQGQSLFFSKILEGPVVLTNAAGICGFFDVKAVAAVPVIQLKP